MGVQLQHRFRREGGITVGKIRYTLDDRGVVEVDEFHAENMLQGAAWRKLMPDGSMPWAEPPPAPPMEAGAAGRRPRTKEELLGLADTQGIPVTEAIPFDRRGRTVKQDKPPVSPSADEEAAAAAATTLDLPSAQAEPETIEVSMDNTKAELVEACEQLEISVPSSANKAQLLELIRQQGD